MTFALSTAQIREHLKKVSETDSHVREAIKLVGYPQERRNPEGFETLLRVIVGQQLSVKAAASIWNKVATLLGETSVTPDSIAAHSDEDLRSAGLSRQKIKYCRSLADTILAGDLDITALKNMDDAEITQAITQVKGLGVWSAHMYLMFSLGRTNIWPVGDLAVRVGIGRIIGLEDRPTEKGLEEIGERWHPYRSSMALLAWHYYSNAPF